METAADMEEEETTETEEQDMGSEVEQEQTEYISEVPAAYFENSDQPGQVIQVTFGGEV